MPKMCYDDVSMNKTDSTAPGRYHAFFRRECITYVIEYRFSLGPGSRQQSAEIKAKNACCKYSRSQHTRADPRFEVRGGANVLDNLKKGGGGLYIFQIRLLLL